MLLAALSGSCAVARNFPGGAEPPGPPRWWWPLPRVVAVGCGFRFLGWFPLVGVGCLPGWGLGDGADMLGRRAG
jgi:hypothetical protein